MKALILAVCLVSPTVCFGQYLEPPMGKIDESWKNEGEHEGKEKSHASKKPFAYQIINVHWLDMITLSYQDQPAPEEDPFGLGGANKIAKPPILGKFVPVEQRPSCLSKGSYFHLHPSFLGKCGIQLEKNEWVMVSMPEGQKCRVYSCATRVHGDLLTTMLVYLVGGMAPSSIDQRYTLVSIVDNSLEDSPWTLKKIAASQPIIHSRSGVWSRSGIKAISSSIKQETPANARVESLINRAEDDSLFSLELNYRWKSIQGDIQIQQQTSLDGLFGTPSIIDCGTHGEAKRRFLLIVHANVTWVQKQNRTTKHIPIPKINGKYALPKPSKTTQLTEEKHHFTRIQMLARFNDVLQWADDAADQDPKQKNYLPSPPRVTGYVASKHMPAGDFIVDITKHMKKIGMALFPKEHVYYNNTKKQLILFGRDSIRHRAQFTIESRLKSYEFPTHTQRTSYRIIEVDINGLERPHWTQQEIQKRNPTTLLSTATHSLSGKKAKAGLPIVKLTRNKENKLIRNNHHEYETEQKLGPQKSLTDLTFRIANKNPIGKDQFMFEIASQLYLIDGQPAIIDIGHPTKANRTRLLIITAHIMLPDGRFYRDRFQPIP